MQVLLNILRHFSRHNQEEEPVISHTARKLPHWVNSRGKARSNAQNYYFPDFEIYYSVPTAEWIYFNGSNWVKSESLPKKYRHVNLFCANKVPLDHKGTNPHLLHEEVKEKYPSRTGKSFYREFGVVKRIRRIVIRHQVTIFQS
jgi:hypothetical protein